MSSHKRRTLQKIKSIVNIKNSTKGLEDKSEKIKRKGKTKRWKLGEKR